jgi:alpha-glucoside transport system permease protein
MSITKRLARIGLPRLIVNVTMLVVVLLWIMPTLGILVSSFRDKDQLAVSGWWTAFSSAERNEAGRLAGLDKMAKDGPLYVIAGNVLDGKSGSIVAFGVKAIAPTAYKAGTEAELDDGIKLTINTDGSYRYTNAVPFTEDNAGRRVYLAVATAPIFTLSNYHNVLTGQGIGQSFVNSLTVAIPATVIPILVAAFAAYALSWMSFKGRTLLLAAVVGLIVVPLQMSLIPLLRLYNEVGTFMGVPSKTYAGIWLAHTGFGLPLAIYLLRNYIVGLPKEIIESARVDGAGDFEIFVRIVLPLSFPALASFAIFQFLWVWNDLLVAMVFLGTEKDHLVLTGALNALLGSRGGNWEILSASAFVSILVPLLVFFSLQRYLVRGLLAGSVKGG